MDGKNKEQDSPKCAALMDAGRKLFWKYGFRRVSVEEICREADVSKMTFYRCFENKTDLAQRIYLKVIRDSVIRFNKIMEEDTPPAEKFRQMLTIKMEGTSEISREFMTDFYTSPDAGMKNFVEEITRQTWTDLVSSFRKAQEKGFFRKDFKPEFLLYISQHLAPLMNDDTLLALYGTPQNIIMEFANFFTYGIAPHD
ncbi:MAG: TetR/AcrR family transcriptional regulator [Bacteroidales bacterium]|nr:TetR/AcrR family transcriptional regulator [Bacteroidales bacterium]